MTRLLVLSYLLIVALSYSAFADTFGNGGNTFNIDFVSIRNPGNGADTTGIPNPVGSVPYAYNMGRFEVSRDMITKANALGNLGITLADMTPYGSNGVNRPATGVTWNAAARFINWLNTSTGSPPAYKFAAQPGEGGYSANANIQLWTPSDAGYNPSNPYRNSLARYFLPSVDEWYKAAYFDPTSGAYKDYPTGSNSAPTPVASGTAPGTAVYNGQSGPADITFAGGLSPYGTMGQAGNVNEWEETDLDLLNGPSSSLRGIRGGYWVSLSSVLSSSNRGNSGPASGGIDLGFRVASIPEPNTLLLGAIGFNLVMTARRRTATHNPA